MKNNKAMQEENMESQMTADERRCKRTHLIKSCVNWALGQTLQPNKKYLRLSAFIRGSISSPNGLAIRINYGFVTA
jgi:hypothetical protein